MTATAPITGYGLMPTDPLPLSTESVIVLYHCPRMDKRLRFGKYGCPATVRIVTRGDGPGFGVKLNTANRTEVKTNAGPPTSVAHGAGLDAV